MEIEGNGGCVVEASEEVDKTMQITAMEDTKQDSTEFIEAVDKCNIIVPSQESSVINGDDASLKNTDQLQNDGTHVVIVIGNIRRKLKEFNL